MKESPPAETQPAPIVAVVGPTGSGKSALALKLAGHFPVEIVNCDSVQVYRHFNVGTAKVPPDERRGVPHHLIDLLEPDEPFTAGDYAHLARPLLAEITARRRLPVVVGGTGFYLRALLEGLFTGPSRDDALRQRLAAREAARPGSLHRLLTRFDDASAARIHPRDVNKVMRAVEVCLLARAPMSELWRSGRDGLEGFRTLKLGLDPERQELYRRLDQRCLDMFDAGLVAETEQILAMGYKAEVKPMESLGYKEALGFLRGDYTRGEAIELAQRNTRRYAKRQLTWFRAEAGVVWLNGFGDEEAVQAAAVQHTRDHLSSSGDAPGA